MCIRDRASPAPLSDRLAVATAAGGRDAQRDPAALLRPGVPFPRGAVELTDLIALAELENRSRLVAEVDAPLVPAQLPNDRDPHRARRAGGGADRDPGLAQGPHQAGWS